MSETIIIIAAFVLILHGLIQLNGRAVQLVRASNCTDRITDGKPARPLACWGLLNEIRRNSTTGT